MYADGMGQERDWNNTPGGLGGSWKRATDDECKAWNGDVRSVYRDGEESCSSRVVTGGCGFRFLNR